MPVRPFDVVLASGKAVVRATIAVPRGRSTPIQVLDEEGSVGRGIGLIAGRSLDVSDPLNAARRLATARDAEGIWSAYWHRYEISRFSLDGAEEVRVVRRSEWFRPYDPRPRIPGEGYATPQRPRIEALVEPVGGLLWVAISQGDDDYEPTIGGPEGPVLDPYAANNERLDTRLEVLDVTGGRVVARRDFEEHLQVVNTSDGRPLFFSLRESALGDLVVDIWQMRLVGR